MGPESGPVAFRDAIVDAAVRQAQNTPAVRGANWRVDTVTNVNSDGTVSVGDIRARRLESYTQPRIGDKVMISQNASGNWLAIGRTATAATVLGVPQYAYKATYTDRTSTTTQTADPELTLPLDASATYLAEFHLFVGGVASGLMVTSWITPSGATGLKGVHGPASTAAGTDSATNAGDNIPGRFGSHNFGTTVTYGRRNANTNLLYAVETGVITTTTAGTLALAWAQSASNATFTRMGLGSWMRVTRLA